MTTTDDKLTTCDPVDLFDELLNRELDGAALGMIRDSLAKVRVAYQSGPRGENAADYGTLLNAAKAMLGLVDDLRSEGASDQRTVIAYADEQLSEFIYDRDSQCQHWQTEFSHFLKATV